MGMRESDEKRKEAVQMKNDGETLCYQVEKQLSDLKEKISTADADDLKKKMEELRTVMAEDGAEPDDIKGKTKDLQEASWKVTQEAYAQSNTDGGDEGDGAEKKDEKKDDAKDSKSEEKEKK